MNVVAKHPKLAKQLHNKLMSWLQEVDAKFPEKDTEYDSIKDAKRDFNIINQKLKSLEKNRLEILSKDFKPNAN